MELDFSVKENPDHVQKTTAICYYIYVIFSVIFCICIMPRYCKKLYKELNHELIDVFKITQLLFIVLYLVTRNLICFVLFIPNIEYYYIPTNSIPAYFFYFYEFVNNLCWICFILHIKTCKPGLRVNEIKSKTLCKEKMFLIFTGFVLVTSFLIILLTLTVTLIFKCYKCDYYKHQLGCTDKCLSLYRYSSDFRAFLFYIGAFSAVLKIFIGVYLLRTMRRELYIPYLKVRKRIVITMVCTVSSMLINAAFNLLLNPSISYSVFSILYAARIHKNNIPKIIICAFSEYLAYLSEAFLLCYTTNNINYREYLNFLTIGIRSKRFIFKISLFLVHSPKTIPDYEDGSSDFKDSDKSDDLNVRAQVAIYNKESRTTSHFSEELTFGGENYSSSERISFLSKPFTMSKQSTRQNSTDV